MYPQNDGITEGLLTLVGNLEVGAWLRGHASIPTESLCVAVAMRLDAEMGSWFYGEPSSDCLPRELRLYSMREFYEICGRAGFMKGPVLRCFWSIRVLHSWVGEELPERA